MKFIIKNGNINIYPTEDDDTISNEEIVAAVMETHMQLANLVSVMDIASVQSIRCLQITLKKHELEGYDRDLIIKELLPADMNAIIIFNPEENKLSISKETSGESPVMDFLLILNGLLVFLDSLIDSPYQRMTITQDRLNIFTLSDRFAHLKQEVKTP